MNQKYSLTVRIICGVLGAGGVAAIAINAIHDGGIQPSFLLLARLFAGFIFLYVAIFADNPLPCGAVPEPPSSSCPWLAAGKRAKL